MATKPPETLRILCFGDSLTAGYTRYGLEHFPYSDYLENTLRKFLPSTKIIIDTDGLSGDCVNGGRFLRRMEGKCAKAGANPYDWVIILGGTNDLGGGDAPEDIYEALSMLFLAYWPSRDHLAQFSDASCTKVSQNKTHSYSSFVCTVSCADSSNRKGLEYSSRHRCKCIGMHCDRMCGL